jgi:hypothetical protein
MANKFSSIHFFAVLILSCTTQRRTTSTNDAEIIKQLEYNAISAEFRLDTAAIARIIHDNFIAVYPHKLQNKQQELTGIYNNITQRKKEGETMDSLYLDDFRAQFHNHTAIVTFYTVTKGTRKGVPYENQRWRWYDVWVKENGEWKLVSVQGTPLKKE